MKKFILLISIFLSANILTAQWIQQEISPICDLTSLSFVDENNGWMTGYDSDSIVSKLFNTINGGEDWSYCEGTDLFYSSTWTSVMGIHDIYNRSDIYFIDQDNGWQASSHLLRTTTNGSNECYADWAFSDPGNPDHFYKIFFTDSNHGWVAGIFIDDVGGVWFLLYRTINGGNYWTGLSVSTLDWVWDIYFIDENEGWIVGLDLGLRHTLNGGENWLSPNLDITGGSLIFINSQKGWITGMGESNGIWYTVDGGINVEMQVGDSIPQLNDITFVDENNGWAVGNEGTILNTSNGGSIWEYQDSGTTEDLKSIDFVDQYNGWICGDNGIILHTDNGGSLRTNEISHKQNILSIFPNPTNGITQLKFDLSKVGEVSVSIQNINGKEIDFIQFGTKKTGSYELDCSKYSPGIYFITLQSDSAVITEKLIVE